MSLPDPDALFERIMAELRAREARQATAVDTLLSESGDGPAVTGAAATLAALDAGLAAEILVTRRHVEMDAASMAPLLALAAARRVRVTSISGMPALQLDLCADGIGAVLRAGAKARRSMN